MQSRKKFKFPKVGSISRDEIVKIDFDEWHQQIDVVYMQDGERMVKTFVPLPDDDDLDYYIRYITGKFKPDIRLIHDMLVKVRDDLKYGRTSTRKERVEASSKLDLIIKKYGGIFEW